MRLANSNTALQAALKHVMITAAMPSSQVVNNQPAEQEEDDDSTPKYPLVLFRSPFNHAYRIAADTQGICHSV